ncbi:uncharacterized protein EV422DRAFT_517031 [Fimicolochytrium jonesii]|uniref:uncharacterized protein n=1 Tax=Fimicolochytrium jonesii TaxID=1396493 RepID=UPI0022FE7DFF|nr:uncharacterized protein EV422DRAFT_517031 [Fimicolochytrium jonesii]KAI8824994.1 hypothetical protein EV422DRAFT_517031 [Fimicolochytrium jonesii]
MLRFDDCFWGTGEDATAGVRALHTVFLQHLAEVEDMLNMVKLRVKGEESYSMNLLELGRHSGSMSMGNPSVSAILDREGPSRRNSRASTPAIAAGNMIGAGNEKSKLSLNNIAQGLGNAAAMLQSAAAASGLPGTSGWTMTAEPESDTSTVGPIVDQSSVLPVIRTMREQYVAMAAAHRRHADTLTLAVISPLQAFVEQHRRSMIKKKSEVDSNHQQLTRLAADIEARHAVYIQKCKIAEEEDKKFREDGEQRACAPSSAPVMVGSRSVGPNEFQRLVETMRKEVRTKSIMTEVGLFEGCFTGEDALDYLKKRYPGVPRNDLKSVCQEILGRRLMSVLVGPNDRQFNPELPYQFGRPVLKSGEPPHVKARKDSEVARLDYDSAIKTAEHTRSALEFHITDYLVSAQEAERYRLKVCKEAAFALESAQVFVLSENTLSWRPPALVDAQLEAEKNGQTESGPPTTLLVSPDPKEGVQYIARTHRTGHLRSKPFVFESYTSGRAPHQVFGISLEELSRATNASIPPMVRKCVSSLYESFTTGRSVVDNWILPNPDLPSVQFLRLEFNSSPRASRVTTTALRRYQPPVVAGVLKLYLVEAPVSLCSYDTYETLRTLYSDDFTTVEDAIRIKSIVSLLKTLSAPHYETLKLFTGYLHELIKPLEQSDERITRLAYSIAPCILRPKTETSETLQDQHPWRFSLELMVRYTDFFGQLDTSTLIIEDADLPPSPEPEEDVQDEDALTKVPSATTLATSTTTASPGSPDNSTPTPPATPPLREPVSNKRQGSWLLRTLNTASNSDLSKAVKGEKKPAAPKPAPGDTRPSRPATRVEERLTGAVSKAKARPINSARSKSRTRKPAVKKVVPVPASPVVESSVEAPQIPSTDKKPLLDREITPTATTHDSSSPLHKSSSLTSLTSISTSAKSLFGTFFGSREAEHVAVVQEEEDADQASDDDDHAAGVSRSAGEKQKQPEILMQAVESPSAVVPEAEELHATTEEHELPTEGLAYEQEESVAGTETEVEYEEEVEYIDGEEEEVVYEDDPEHYDEEGNYIGPHIEEGELEHVEEGEEEVVYAESSTYDDTTSHYEDGEEGLEEGEEYVEGEEEEGYEYAEGEVEYVEEGEYVEGEYEEETEVVVEDGEHAEYEEEVHVEGAEGEDQQAPAQSELAENSGLFPSSEQEMNEYLQWG